MLEVSLEGHEATHMIAGVVVDGLETSTSSMTGWRRATTCSWPASASTTVRCGSTGGRPGAQGSLRQPRRAGRVDRPARRPVGPRRHRFWPGSAHRLRHSPAASQRHGHGGHGGRQLRRQHFRRDKLFDSADRSGCSSRWRRCSLARRRRRPRRTTAPWSMQSSPHNRRSTMQCQTSDFRLVIGIAPDSPPNRLY